jgi:curli biogenesis system outer membrane secretion channel CsgG
MSVKGLADALARQTDRAASARWLVIGQVTGFSANRITATIDGISIGNIRRCATWVAPAYPDVALFAVIRGTSSVQYIGIDKITP